MNENSNKVLICGLGRSGTTWIYKVFDWHPNVLGIFEPDVVYRRPPGPQSKINAGEVLKLHFNSRPLRAMRRRPIIRKPYRNKISHQLRVFYMYALSGLGLILPKKWIESATVPDLIIRDVNLTKVVKIVGLQSHLRSLAESSSNMKIIYVIRHPCGYVASYKNGMDKGFMPKIFLPPRDGMKRLYTFDRPIEELSENDFSPIQRMAYLWSVLNDTAIQAAKVCQNIRVYYYEDICLDPIRNFTEMIEWSGLGWHRNCRDFVSESLSTDSDAIGYHDLIRNPTVAANSWAKVFSEDEKSQIFSIVAPSEAFVRYR